MILPLRLDYLVFIHTIINIHTHIIYLFILTYHPHMTDSKSSASGIGLTAADQHGA